MKKKLISGVGLKYYVCDASIPAEQHSVEGTGSTTTSAAPALGMISREYST